MDETNQNIAGALENLIQSCGNDCIDFDTCDFLKFAVFFAGSKSFGSGCSPSIRRDAMLAYSLGMALMVELSLKEQGEGTLNQIGICAVLSKINKLIKKCCSYPEFFKVMENAEEQRKKRHRRITERLADKNARLGLTPESTVLTQENIKLDLTYNANCSDIKEMAPGTTYLGVRVTRISHNGKMIDLNRDNCLRSGKVWNTINSTCYCMDERQIPHVTMGDTKIDKKYFHLGPPKSWVKVSAIRELNLEPRARARFEDIIAHKENIDLSKLQKTECGLKSPCIWYSCLIDGITNYFLACKRDSNNKIHSCYYNRNLLSSTISSVDQARIIEQQHNSINHCCDKCYQSGCECSQTNLECECVGVSNQGVPCNQITARSAAMLQQTTNSQPVLRTNSFNSDNYVAKSLNIVDCCDSTAECPEGMSDAECCQIVCRQREIEILLGSNASSVKRITANNPVTNENLSGTCTCKKCGASAQTESAQSCMQWIETHKRQCNNGKPAECNQIIHSGFSIAELTDFKRNTDNNSCCGNDGGCCTCQGYDREGKFISWPCCCKGDISSRDCCSMYDKSVKIISRKGISGGKPHTGNGGTTVSNNPPIGGTGNPYL
jgi:hypothetical protein